MDWSILIYPIAFILTLSLVVSVHEYGHFAVGRYFGVHAIRFAIGFGRPLLRWQDRRGTEFCLCAIPLGGYVRFLDSRQDDISPEQHHQDFASQSVLARILIYAAGPIANFVLAGIVLFIVGLLGTQEYRPIVGAVVTDSPAAQAGMRPNDEIIQFEGKSVTSWNSFTMQLVDAAGHSGSLEFEVQRNQAQLVKLAVSVDRFMQSSAANPFEQFGIIPKIQMREPIIGQVIEGSAAAQANWQQGDRVLSIDNQTIKTWQDLVEIVQANPGAQLDFELQRVEQIVGGTIILDQIESAGKSIGRVGAAVQMADIDPNLIIEEKHNPVQALSFAVVQTGLRVQLVLTGIWKLLTGGLALDNVTGPLTISQIAGQTVQSGATDFLNFVAYLSVSLGVFNLLPIPMLDGGHIVFAGYEMARGKALGVELQQRFMMVGLVLLVGLMSLAVVNDLVRLL